MIKKGTILFLIVISTYCSNAQLFTWAQCSPESGIEYISACTGKDSSITLLLETSQLSYTNAPSGFYDAEGENHLRTLRGAKYALVNFSKKGIIQWSQPLYGKENQFYSVVCRPNGNYIVMLYLEAEFTEWNVKEATYHNYDEESEEGYDDEIYNYGGLNLGLENKDLYSKYGFHFLELDQQGKFVEMNRMDILPECDLDFGKMIMHPNGNILLVGNIGANDRFSDKTDIVTTRGGADFIAAFSPSGELIWSDILLSSSNSCCSYYNEYVQLTIDKYGDIYFAGNIREEVIFGGKKVIAAQLPYSPKPNSDKDIFLSKYDKDGHFLWAQVAGAKGETQALATVDNTVYLSLRVYHENKVFGQNLNVNEFPHNCLVSFSQQGEVTKIKTSIAPIYDMYNDNEGHLIVLGGRDKTWKEEADTFATLKKRDNFFIAYLNPDLSVVRSKAFHLLVSHEYETYLLPNYPGTLFLYGELFASLPLDASTQDKAFKAGKLYGGAAFVGMFDF